MWNEMPNLKDICESLYFSETGIQETNPYTIIPVVRQSIFDFAYPIFDENYRALLETKILKKYYTRDICRVEYWRWKMDLDVKMNEIMPYYNKLYESAAIELNPLYNFTVDVEHRDSGGDAHESEESKNNDKSHGTTRQHEDNVQVSGSDSNESSSTANNKERFLDTPQGRLDEIENNKYLTNATLNDESNNSKNTTNYGKNTLDKLKEVITGKDVSNEIFKKKEQITTTRAYVEEVRGRRDVSDSELLLKYRETFIKIDEMLLRELNGCFSLLFS